jgi:transposase-like protein
MSSWSDAPIVFLPQKKCPFCRHTRFIHVWSELGGDNSRSQRQICRSCSKRVIFVLEDDAEESSTEIPNRGNLDFDTP